MCGKLQGLVTYVNEYHVDYVRWRALQELHFDGLMDVTAHEKSNAYIIDL